MVTAQVLADFIEDFHDRWEKSRRREPFLLSTYFHLADLARNEPQFTSLLLDLLHPDGPHKLGETPLRMFLQMVGVSSDGRLETQRGFKLAEGIPDLVIERSDGVGVLGSIFLENKPFAREGSRQLDRYTTALQRVRSTGERVLIYLPGFKKDRHFSKRRTEVRRIVVPYLKEHRPEHDESPTSIEEWLSAMISSLPLGPALDAAHALIGLSAILDLIKVTFSHEEDSMTDENELRAYFENESTAWRQAFEVYRAFNETIDYLRQKTLNNLSNQIKDRALKRLGDEYEEGPWHSSLAEKNEGPFVRKNTWPQNTAVGISSDSGNGCGLIIGVCAPVGGDKKEDKSELSPDQCKQLRTLLKSQDLTSKFPAKCREKYNGWYPWYLERALDELGDDETMAGLATGTRREEKASEYAEHICAIATAVDHALSALNVKMPRHGRSK